MTRDDIIKAAFKVWGREFYQTTSLTDVARELGVSKAALYRYFEGKDALLDAMYTAFFENFISFIKEDYEKALSTGSIRERCLIMLRVVTKFYLRNRDAFLFSLMRVYGSREMNGMLHSRGIDLRKLQNSEEPEVYPSVLQFINVSLVFWTACFHRFVYKGDSVPPEDLVQKVLALVENRITSGLGISTETIEALDYAALEERVAKTVYKNTEDSKLLRAVANAVAEVGPWNVSMKMVAKRLGLSKSSLYAHFKNKQDMMRCLFITESERIAAYAGTRAKISKVPEERLYLIIISIVEYLRSRPDILAAINWLKTGRLDLFAIEEPPHIYEIITSLPFEVFNTDKDEKGHIAQWIIFLIISTMIWPTIEQRDTPVKPAWCKGKNVPNESIRLLFRYISCGLEIKD
jgi:AcrR family transcriptional regulator